MLNYLVEGMAYRAYIHTHIHIHARAHGSSLIVQGYTNDATFVPCSSESSALPCLAFHSRQPAQLQGVG